MKLKTTITTYLYSTSLSQCCVSFLKNNNSILVLSFQGLTRITWITNICQPKWRKIIYIHRTIITYKNKFIKNPISIRISSNFLHNIRTCICIRKNYKNGQFSPSHFWRNTLYYSTGSLARFLSNFKKFIKNPILIRISSNFLHNIRTCICIRKNYKNGQFSPSHF